MAFAKYLIFAAIVTEKLVLSISVNSGEKPVLNGHVYITQNINDFPYIASLEYQGKPRCTATIIRSEFVLTAYRCVVNVFPDDLRIRAGPIGFNSRGEKFVQIKEIENIEEEIILDASLTLLKLKSAFELSEFVNVINLARDKQFFNDNLTVVGFEIKACDVRSNYLLLGKVRFMENEFCEKQLGLLTEAQVCTSSDAFTNSAIRGEAGGPLLKRSTGKLDKDLLFGIVVFSRMERQNQFSPVSLTVYADIVKLHSWIESSIKVMSSS